MTDLGDASRLILVFEDGTNAVYTYGAGTSFEWNNPTQLPVRSLLVAPITWHGTDLGDALRALVATWRKRQTVLEQLYEANREDHRAFAFGCASEAKIFEEHADDLDAILATVGDPPQETNT